eukprot:1157867-Pelagomonas_calceolata.AAC.1
MSGMAACQSAFSGIARLMVHFAGVKGKIGTALPLGQLIRASLQLQHLGINSGQKCPAQDDGDFVEESTQPQASPKQGSRAAPLGQHWLQCKQASMYPISYTQVRNMVKQIEAYEAISTFLSKRDISINVNSICAWIEMWDSVRKAGQASELQFCTSALKQVHTCNAYLSGLHQSSALAANMLMHSFKHVFALEHFLTCIANRVRQPHQLNANRQHVHLIEIERGLDNSWKRHSSSMQTSANFLLLK